MFTYLGYTVLESRFWNPQTHNLFHISLKPSFQQTFPFPLFKNTHPDPGCAQGDLEQSFLKYDASMLHGNMVVGQAETSWLRCAVTCLLALGTCRSVDLDHSRGLCFANGDDVVGALPWLVLGADPNYVHLQRTCKWKRSVLRLGQPRRHLAVPVG